MTQQLYFAKPFPSCSIGFASQRNPMWLIRFASQSLFSDCIGFALQSQSIRSNCFASQSQSFMIDLLCFTKPILYDGFALLHKAFLMMDWLCFTKPIHFDGIALLPKANPLPICHLGFFGWPFLALSIFPVFRW